MKRTREEIEDWEIYPGNLAGVAQRSREAGRFWPEPEDEYRTKFARDRDKIVHSTAFQLLVNKTQVFPATDPSKYTTRLLHTIKVAQIAVTISRALRLNEDLTLAIALGHDAGHSPFGHAGEEILRQSMMDVNGFEHNEASVVVLLRLEQLNITIPTLEGILKHTRFEFEPYDKANKNRVDPFPYIDMPKPGAKRKEDPFKYWGGRDSEGKLEFEAISNYEGQVVDIADEVAYLTHDIVDLARRGLLDLREFPEGWLRELGAGGDPGPAIDHLVRGVIDENAPQLEQMAQVAIDERTFQITHPRELLERVNEVKRWFKKDVYEGKLSGTTNKAKEVMSQVFKYYEDNLEKLENESPTSSFYKSAKEQGFRDKELIAYSLVGLTDYDILRIFEQEHPRLVFL